MAKAKKIVIARPAHEVALFGGPATVDLEVGQRFRLHPESVEYLMGHRFGVFRGVAEESPKLTIKVSIEARGKGSKRRVLAASIVYVDENGIGA